MMFFLSGYFMSRLVGLSVLKGLFSTYTLLLVSRLRSVDLPELV